MVDSFLQSVKQSQDSFYNDEDTILPKVEVVLQFVNVSSIAFGLKALAVSMPKNQIHPFFVMQYLQIRASRFLETWQLDITLISDNNFRSVFFEQF